MCCVLLTSNATRENNGPEMESSGVGSVILRGCNGTKALFLRRPHIFIHCLKRRQVHGRLTASQQTVQNILMATVEFLDQTKVCGPLRKLMSD